MSVLGTHLCQCTSWWYCERLCSASVNFFWRLSPCLPISWWVIYKHTCPHQTECSAVFGQETAWPLCLTLPIHTVSLWATFFCCFFRWKKSSKGNVLPMRKRWNKNSRSTKRQQNWWVQKLLWAMEENIPIGVLHQMESSLKETEV